MERVVPELVQLKFNFLREIPKNSKTLMLGTGTESLTTPTVRRVLSSPRVRKKNYVVLLRLENTSFKPVSPVQN